MWKNHCHKDFKGTVPEEHDDWRTLYLVRLSLQLGLTFHIIISNSLIMHEENTKEINTETEFGYVMKHLHKIKSTFISIFSLNTDLFEMLYQTLGRVFHLEVVKIPKLLCKVITSRIKNK